MLDYTEIRISVIYVMYFSININEIVHLYGDELYRI